MSQFLRKPYVDDSPLFGPCNHESGGSAVSRDLCAVRSGDPKVNKKCGTCESPYRLCQKCARENRRRLVIRPATGDGLCQECKHPPLTPVESKSPKSPKAMEPVVLQQLEPEKPKTIVVVVEPASSPLLEKEEPPKNEQKPKRPPLLGKLLVEVVRAYCNNVGNVTQQQMARLLHQPLHMMNGISRCSRLSQDMMELIEKHNLSMQGALAVASFPKGIRPLLAERVGARTIHVWRLEAVARMHTLNPARSWRTLLKEHESIDWPEGVPEA